MLGISPLEELGLEDPLDAQSNEEVAALGELLEFIRQAEAQLPQSEQALKNTLLQIDMLSFRFMTQHPQSPRLDRVRLLRVELAARSFWTSGALYSGGNESGGTGIKLSRGRRENDPAYTPARPTGKGWADVDVTQVVVRGLPQDYRNFRQPLSQSMLQPNHETRTRQVGGLANHPGRQSDAHPASHAEQRPVASSSASTLPPSTTTAELGTRGADDVTETIVEHEDKPETASPLDPRILGSVRESIEDARVLLALAYPTSIDMREAAKVELNKLLVTIPGNTMTADTVVNYWVRPFDSGGKQWGTMSLLDIALGTLFKLYPNMEFRIDMPMAYWDDFGMGYLSGSVPVTEKLHRILDAQIRHFEQDPTNHTARNRLHRGMVRLRVLQYLSDPSFAQVRPALVQALTDMLNGNEPAYTLTFNNVDVNDVFAVKVGEEGYLLFSVSRPGMYFMQNMPDSQKSSAPENYTRNTSDAFRKWLAPSLSLDLYLAYGGKAENFDISRTWRPNLGGAYSTPEKPKFVAYDKNPYGFTPVSGRAGPERLAERLSELEAKRTRVDLNTLFFTASEYWANVAVTFGKSVLEGWSLALTMVGSAPGALGSRAAMLFGSLGLGAASTTMTGWLASVEDNPNQRDELYRDMLIGIALSAPGNLLDTVALLAKFVKTREAFAAATKAATDRIKLATGRVGEAVRQYGPTAAIAPNTGNQVVGYARGASGSPAQNLPTHDVPVANDRTPSLTPPESEPPPSSVHAVDDTDTWRERLARPAPVSYVRMAITELGYQALISPDQVTWLCAEGRNLSALGISPLDELGLDRELPLLHHFDPDPLSELRNAIERLEREAPQSAARLLGLLQKVDDLAIRFIAKYPESPRIDMVRRLRVQLRARALSSVVTESSGRKVVSAFVGKREISTVYERPVTNAMMSREGHE
ncbi:hypothetical protein [Burkholderia ubonensis]|uniref:hypothetical protein n=1 Tax=Burkholderia ubonensis TaxID=101571 RepID=UPI0012FA81A8|nr:hypothetical protein [Burkholderia ubonensis]